MEPRDRRTRGCGRARGCELVSCQEARAHTRLHHVASNVPAAYTVGEALERGHAWEELLPPSILLVVFDRANQSMRASCCQAPLAPVAPSTKVLPKFDSHTTRTRRTKQTAHNASLRAPSAANVSRLSLLGIPAARQRLRQKRRRGAGASCLVPRQRRTKNCLPAKWHGDGDGDDDDDPEWQFIE